MRVSDTVQNVPSLPFVPSTGTHMLYDVGFFAQKSDLAMGRNQIYRTRVGVSLRRLATTSLIFERSTSPPFGHRRQRTLHPRSHGGPAGTFQESDISERCCHTFAPHRHPFNPPSKKILDNMSSSPPPSCCVYGVFNIGLGCHIGSNIFPPLSFCVVFVVVSEFVRGRMTLNENATFHDGAAVNASIYYSMGSESLHGHATDTLAEVGESDHSVHIHCRLNEQNIFLLGLSPICTIDSIS